MSVAPIVERTVSVKPSDPLAFPYAGLYFALDEAK